MKQKFLWYSVLLWSISLLSNKIYIGNFDNDTISFFDSSSDIVKGLVHDPLHTFNSIFFIIISPDGHTAYVANHGGTISIIDVATDTVTGVISTPGTNLFSMNITPDGKKMYVVQDRITPILIIDLQTHSYVGNVNDSFSPLAGPQFMTILPDGTRAYVTDYDGDKVVIIDVATDTVIGLVQDPGSSFQGPFPLTVTPDGKSIYVGDYVPDTVSVVDVATNKVVKVITHPALNTIYDIKASDTKVYVDSFVGPGTNNIIHVIDIATNTVIDIISNPLIDDFYFLGLTPDYTKIYTPGYHLYQLHNSNVGDVDLITDTLKGLVQDPNHTFVGCYAIGIVPSANTPMDVTISSVCNVFLTQTDIINIVSWSPSSFVGSKSVKYSLYRDAALTNLVGTVLANEKLQIKDHNRKPNTTYTYYLVAIDQFNNFSAPVVMTITSKKCC